MKAQDEFIRTLQPPVDLHESAVTQAISALLPQIAATDLSYKHCAEICRLVQNMVYDISRGSGIVHRKLLLLLILLSDYIIYYK